MGGTKVSNQQEPTADILAAYEAGLGPVLQVMAENILPTELAKLQASQVIDPERAKLQTDIFDTEGRRLNQIGAELQNEAALARAQGEADILGGAGQELARNAIAAQAILDPEFIKSRGQVGDKITELLSNVGAGLTGSERAEVERNLAQSNAQRGNLSTPTALGTVENAMAFGQAGQQKLNNLASTIANVSQSLPALRTGESAFTQATGRSASQANPGVPQFVGTQQLGKETFGVGQGLLNNAFGNASSTSTTGGAGAAMQNIGALAGGLGQLA